MTWSVDQLKELSVAYGVAVESNALGFSAFSQLQPWQLLPSGEIFDVAEQWPSAGATPGKLVAFAVRQDCDDIACFELDQRRVSRVLLIEGWSEGSYTVFGEFQTFTDWLNAAKRRDI